MISDMGYYTAYNSDLSTAPKCWISEGYRSQHYYQTIVGGLEHSCNYFFYECGSRLGETRLYQYAAAFGLTSKTGIVRTRCTTRRSRWANHRRIPRARLSFSTPSSHT